MNSLLTASEIATILKIHVNTVYYYLVAKKLRGHRVIGNRWRIKATDLDAFINGTEPEHGGHNNNKNISDSPAQVAGSAPTTEKK